jgi:hypothetical protein
LGETIGHRAKFDFAKMGKGALNSLTLCFTNIAKQNNVIETQV